MTRRDAKIRSRQIKFCSREKPWLRHRSTLNYTNLQMTLNEEWKRKASSFCTGILAVTSPTRFPMHTRISTTILPTVSCLRFYFWLNGTGSSLLLKPTADANSFLDPSFRDLGVFVLVSLRIWRPSVKTTIVCFDAVTRRLDDAVNNIDERTSQKRLPFNNNL